VLGGVEMRSSGRGAARRGAGAGVHLVDFAVAAAAAAAVRLAASLCSD